MTEAWLVLLHTPECRVEGFRCGGNLDDSSTELAAVGSHLVEGGQVQVRCAVTLTLKYNRCV